MSHSIPFRALLRDGLKQCKLCLLWKDPLSDFERHNAKCKLCRQAMRKARTLQQKMTHLVVSQSIPVPPFTPPSGPPVSTSVSIIPPAKNQLTEIDNLLEKLQLTASEKEESERLQLLNLQLQAQISESQTRETATLQQISDLTHQHQLLTDIFQTENRKIRDRNDLLDTRCTTTQDKLDRTLKANHDMEKEMTRLNTENQENDVLLSTHETTIMELKESNQRWEQYANSLKAAKETLEKDNTELKQLNAIYKRNMHTHMKERNELKKKYQGWKDTFNEYQIYAYLDDPKEKARKS